MDSLKQVEEKQTYRLGLKDFQVFATKKKKEDEEEPEIEEVEEEEEEEEPKQKSGEEAPAWANNLIKNIAELVKPKEAAEGSQKVPVPPAPPEPEEEEEEEEPQPEPSPQNPLSKFLKWFL